jgi:hypothetical protein
MWRGVFASFTVLVGALTALLMFTLFFAWLAIFGCAAAAPYGPALLASVFMVAAGGEIEMRGEVSLRMLLIAWALLAVGLTTAWLA